MSRNQRIGLVVAALALAVIGFALASPGGGGKGERAARTSSDEASPANDDGDAGGTDTRTDSEPESPATPPEPKVARIRIRAGSVAGGASDIEVSSGDRVRILVSSDAPDELHLHGYDITRQAAPGRPARFRLEARLEGAFELESHAAEDAGRDPLVARLVVEPS